MHLPTELEAADPNFIGKGSYGIIKRYQPDPARPLFINRVRDSGEELVVKVNYLLDEQLGYPTNLREYDIFNKTDHPNIIPLRGAYLTEVPEADNLDYLGLVMPKAKTDLAQLILAVVNGERTLQPVECLYLITDILLGLEYLHRNGYMHSDLKEANVLIQERATPNGGTRLVARLADLGTVDRVANHASRSSGVTTATHSAPEVIISPNYTTVSDVWSAGIILVCLLTRTNIIRNTGGYPSKQLTSLLQTTPIYPSWEELKSAGYSDQLNRKIWLDNNRQRKGESWMRYFETHHLAQDVVTALGQAEWAEELLRGMLCFDPKQRWSASRALESPAFDRCRDWINYVRRNYTKMRGNDAVPFRAITPKHSEYQFLKPIIRKQYLKSINVRDNAHVANIHLSTVALLDYYLPLYRKRWPNSGEAGLVHLYGTLMIMASYYYESLQAPALAASDVYHAKFLTPEWTGRARVIICDVMKRRRYGNLVPPTILDQHLRPNSKQLPHATLVELMDGVLAG